MINEESKFTRMLRENGVISKTMKGFVGWQYFSDRPLTASGLQTLVFFQKLPDEIITNMKSSGSFSKGNDHLVVSFQPEFFNPDGTPFNWSEAGQIGLRQFINNAKLVMYIEDKPYVEALLSDMVKFPDISQDLTGVAISQPQLNAQWKLGTPETIEAVYNFRVEVVGTTGAFDAPFGFKADTRLRLKMNTIRRRNVQS